MTYDKGAMILRMLRWQSAMQPSSRRCTKFFRSRTNPSPPQSLNRLPKRKATKICVRFSPNGSMTPARRHCKIEWTLYRLADHQGFRTVGEIDEDLDLFQMPVEVQVETEGKTVTKRVEVMGPQTQFTIDTFGIPRKICSIHNAGC